MTKERARKAARPTRGRAKRPRPLSQAELRTALRPAPDATLDRHDLYELCVQSPRHLVGLLTAIHGGKPAILAEDFSGTAALSREWVKQIPRGRAIATDLDEVVLQRARTPRITTVAADVLRAPLTPRADVIFVGNFSIGEIHDRPRLVRYLKRCRARLKPKGVFVCDTYGGQSAFRTGAVHRLHPGPRGLTIRYTWEQRRADPLTALVENALHFRVDKDGWIIQEETDAFVYHWRLWSIPELRDAMTEAGFAHVEVYDKAPDAVDHKGQVYIRPVDRVDDSFIVCVAAKK